MAKESYWRKAARPIIKKVIQETKGKPESEIRKALIEAYPFGERSMHPYQMWLKEVRSQRGIKTKKEKTKDEIKGQNELF